MKRFWTYVKLASLGLFIASCGEHNDEAAVPGDNTVQMAQMGSGLPVVPAAETTVGRSADGKVIDDNGWYHDWNTGLAAAKEQGRPVLVDFYTDWCHWCDEMDEKTFADSEIKKKFADGWITIKIDAEDQAVSGTYKGDTLTYPQMAAAFGVTGYPAYVFIDKEGEPIHLLTGYREKEQFTVFLDYFKDEIYKKSEEEQQKFMESRLGDAS